MKAKVAAGVIAAFIAAVVGFLALRGGDTERIAAQSIAPTPALSTAAPTAPSTTEVPTRPLSTAAVGDLAMASGFGDPAVVSIPQPADDSARAWLEGEGAQAVALVTATEQLWASGSSACQATGYALDEAGTPEQLAGAAAGTPDAPTREILLGLHAAAGAALSACLDPEAFADARADLAWQWAPNWWSKSPGIHSKRGSEK